VATRTTTSLLLALWLGPCLATTPAIDPDLDFAPDSHVRFAERVNVAQTTDYQAVLAAYEAHRASHPDDVRSQIEHCRFIENFAYVEEQAIESANDDLTACRTRLKSGLLQADVDVLLYGVESSWEEKSVDAATGLIAKAEFWKDEQQAKLFELLAERTRWKDSEAAADYAMRALELDPGTSVLLVAVERWVQLGAKDKARKALMNAPERTWERVSRAEAAKILLSLGDSKAAADLLRGAKPKRPDPGADLALARALTATGDFDAARKLYREALSREQYVSRPTRIEYFEFERQHGTREDTVSAYEQLRKEGYPADSLARHRLSLLLSWPSVAWQWRDALGVLALLGTSLFFCLLPLIFVVPVHYRGLALRASGRAPVHADPAWRLRDAWYAFAAILFSGFAATYALAPGYLEAMVPWGGYAAFGADPATDRVLAQVMLWSTIVGFIALLPVLRGKPIREKLCGTWSIKRSILIGIGASWVLNLVTRIIGMFFPDVGMLGSDTTRSIQGAHEAYGFLGMMLLLAVMTPIIEELVFRGVMLEAFRRHVSFALATLMQATAFVLMHEEWQSMPFLFVFALIAGLLARKSEGLLAPIAMHAFNNFGAGLAIVGATSLLNR
jgi:CAAX protease family protein